VTEEQSKKSTNKSLRVIALTLICIILAASTAGVLALYLTGPNDQLAEKDKLIADLQLQLQALELQVTRMMTEATQTSSSTDQLEQLNMRLTSLSESYSQLQAAYRDFQSIIDLEKSEVSYSGQLTLNADSASTIYDQQVGYAGFIVLEAKSNSTNTYAQMKYSYRDMAFDYKVNLGTSVKVLLPILPTTLVLSVGNSDLTDAADIEATATLHY